MEVIDKLNKIKLICTCNLEHCFCALKVNYRLVINYFLYQYNQNLVLLKNL